MTSLDRGCQDKFRSDQINQQYLAFVALSLTALGMTAVLLPLSSACFRRFFGNTNPLLVIFLASFLGAVALGFLQSRNGFKILKGRVTVQGIALSAGLATLFGLAIIIADLLIR